MLTLCELNAENLFISLDHYRGEPLDGLSEKDWKKFALPQLRRKQKSIRKLWALGTTIHDINPDVLMLIEVGGRESLDHFNEFFLNKQYTPFFLETNSNRSIDLAYLVKKDLNLTARAISNRDTPIQVEAYQGKFSARFSRDVAELHLCEGEDIRLILLLTHLKSKISTDRDFQGNDVRRAEAQALSALYNKRRAEHPHAGIVVGGDFNSQLTSPELESLTKTDLTDFHDVLGSPPEDRISLVHFDYKRVAHPNVLDYLLVSPDLKSKIILERSSTYRYRSFYNIPHPLPTTPEERYAMPSDHFPLVLTLDFLNSPA